MVAPTTAASSSRNQQTPSADSLAFSAQLYTSQIDSWVPADFGTSFKATDTFTLNSNADQDGNLGIGHPSLEIPKHKRQDHGAGQLEKMLGLNKKGKGRAEEGAVVSKKTEVEDEEEEESRGSIGKKRKIGTVDLLSGKKKAKAKMKARTMEEGPKPINTNATKDDESLEKTPTPRGEEIDQIKTSTPTTSQDTPVSSQTPLPAGTSPNTTLTKNQRKNLRKKQKKAAEAAA